MASEAGGEGTFLAVVNPAAGGGRCGKRAPEAIAELRSAGLSIEVVETTAAGQGTALAREAWQRGVRRFLAVGGDGTSFEIVNGLFPRTAQGEERPTLGFLPLGTGNSFLRDFMEPGADKEAGAELARAALLQGRTRDSDVIRLVHDAGQIHYINLLSLGFVADVCIQANKRFKRFGEAGYAMGVVLEVLGLRCRSIPHQVDGGSAREAATAFLSVNNSRFTGGKMMMAPRADTGDGEADLITVGELGRLSLLRTFPKIFAGTHVDHPAVTQERVRELRFQCAQALPAMIDGEVIELRPESLQVLPSALQVCV